MPRPSAAPAPRRRRLPRSERRAELLDTAAELVAESGLQALTMEGLAARAGVSKGLGYAYFEGAEDVAISLWDREVARVYERIEAASEGAESLEQALRTAVVTYFDVVAERGALLGALHSAFAGARGRRRIARRVRDFMRFWVERVQQAYGVPEGPAWTLASMSLTSVEVACRTWRAGAVSRQTAEQLCFAFLREGLRGASERTGRRRSV